MDTKNFIFRYYVPIALLGCVIAITIVVITNRTIEWKLIFTIFGGFLSAIYFVQKQKLEEMRLFKELFNGFNDRYNEMNQDLNEVLRGNPNEELNPQQIDRLYDYFNLCGEEYLYYKQGYILPEVWESWINGMKIFYKNLRIRDLWENELKTNSYYGFKLNMLEE